MRWRRPPKNTALNPPSVRSAVVFWCGGGGLVIATRKKKTRRKINFLALFNINTQQTTDVDDDDHDEGDDAGWGWLDADPREHHLVNWDARCGQNRRMDGRLRVT